MSQEMECLCLQCGMSSHIPEGDIALEDPSDVESKLLSSLFTCQNCGGRLVLVGKAGDEPHYRIE